MNGVDTINGSRGTFALTGEIDKQNNYIGLGYRKKVKENKRIEFG